MKLGVVTPVVTRLPRAHARWEETAGVVEIERIAREADRLGYEFLTCSEHVAVPVTVAEIRGATYWDPLPTFGYLAACTQRIRLATFVLVLGYHHPLAVAKRYGTLDTISGGRLILGVGVGTLEEEFALLGVPFAGRGRRADDAIRALRAALGRPEPEYSGEHYAFGGFVVDPCAVQARVPLWIGGRSARSLRRAVQLGDGWAPFGLATAELAAMLSRARDSRAWEARDAPLEVVLQNERPLDPSAEPERVRERVARLGEIGATAMSVRFVHHSPAHYLEQLAAMRELEPA